MSYFYKSDKKFLHLPNTFQHGLIAQDLQKVFPEMVKTIKCPVFENNKFVNTQDITGVNYTSIIPVLIKAIQEQQAEIEKLQALLGNNNLSKAELNANSSDNSISLGQNVPNPYSYSTTITYKLPNYVNTAQVAIFDLNGKMLMKYDNLKSKSQIVIDNNKLSAGMYIYSLIINGQETISKKMVISR